MISDERGSISIETSMILPFCMMFMLFLISLGINSFSYSNELINLNGRVYEAMYSSEKGDKINSFKLEDNNELIFSNLFNNYFEVKKHSSNNSSSTVLIDKKINSRDYSKTILSNDFM